MRRISYQKSMKVKICIALGFLSVTTFNYFNGDVVQASATHQYNSVSAHSSTAYSNERADLMDATNNVVMPYFPELVYRPAPNSLVAAKAAAKEQSGFYKAGVLGQVKTGGVWGIVDTQGKVTVAPKYKKLEPAYDGIFYVKDNKKDIYQIDKWGNRLSAADIEKVAAQAKSEELADKQMDSKSSEPILVPYKVDKLMGFQDENGHVIIPAQFKEIYTDFSEGRAFVKTRDNKKVAINEQGEVVFEAPYDDFSAYDNGLAEYRRNVSGFNFGSLLGFVAGGYISGGHGWGYDGGIGGSFTYDGVKRGYLDRDGHIIVDSKLDAVYPMTLYGTAVKNKGQAGFVNRTGKYIIPMGNYEIGQMDSYQGVLTMTNKSTNKVGAFSVVDGTKVIDFSYDSIDFLGNGRLLARKGDIKYLVDMLNGKSLKAFTKDAKIQPFGGENITWLSEEKNKLNIIDLNGNSVYDASPLKITEEKPFSNGNSAVKVNGKWGIVNSQGQWLLPATYDDITLL